MIKRFKTFLKEGLWPEQKAGFEDYAKTYHGIDIHKNTKAINLSNHIIPKGTDSIKIPATNELVSSIHKHLTSNGYSDVDYAKGTVAKKFIDRMGNEKSQVTSIPKALGITKAPQDMIDRYANDDRETSAKLATDHDIIISRNPYHIAGCSTNPDNPNMWSSCASLNQDGIPKDKVNAGGHLPYDIKHGTHVAYLVPKQEQKPGESDKDHHNRLIDQATARILLKPFHSDFEDHAILYPESKVYSKARNEGKGNKVADGFSETVQSFANKHFPMEENVPYNKHDSLYDDDNIGTISKLNINKPIHVDIDHDTYGTLLQNQKIDPADITHFLDNGHNIQPHDPYYSILHHLPDNKGFNKSHIDQYINNGLTDKVGIHGILNHRHFTQQHYNTLVDNAISSPSKLNSLLKTSLYGSKISLSPQHMTKITNMLISADASKFSPTYFDNHIGILSSDASKLSPTDFDNHIGILSSLVRVHKLPYEHVKRIIDNGQNHHIMSLVGYNWENHPDKDKILNDLTKINDKAAITRLTDNNEDLSEQHIDNLLQSPHLTGNALENITANNVIQSHHMHQILDKLATTNDHHTLPTLRNLVIQHTFKPSHFNKILDKINFVNKDNKDRIIDSILYNHKFTSNQLTKLIPKIPDRNKEALIQHQSKNFYPEHIDTLFADPAVQNSTKLLTHLSKLTDNPKHYSTLLNRNDDALDTQVARKTNLLPEHVNTLFNKNNPVIRSSLSLNGFLSKEQHQQMLQDPTLDDTMRNGMLRVLAQSKNVHPDTITGILNKSKTDIDPDNIHRHLLDNRHIKLNKDHLDDLSRGYITNDNLQKVAAHPNISSDTIDHITNNIIFNKWDTKSKPHLIHNLINNPNTSPEQIAKLKSHKEFIHW